MDIKQVAALKYMVEKGDLRSILRSDESFSAESITITAVIPIFSCAITSAGCGLRYPACFQDGAARALVLPKVSLPVWIDVIQGAMRRTMPLILLIKYPVV